MKGIDLAYFDGFKGMVQDRTISPARATQIIWTRLRNIGAASDINMDIAAQYLGLFDGMRCVHYLRKKRQLMKGR